MRVVVVGAGVAGLTAAIALRARDIEVTVLDAAPEPRGSGGGLGIASNATKVLAALGVDLVNAGVGRVCEQFSLRTARGATMRDLPIGSIADELRAPVVNVRRTDLLALLRDALGDTPVHYGSVLTGYRHDGRSVTVSCADGSTFTGDALIGADGIRSAVRTQIVGPEQLHEYGYVCWLATVPFTHSRLPTGGAAHYWGRGRRFGLIDIGGGDVYWWGTANAAHDDRGRWTGAREAILRSFAGWAPEVVEVITGTAQSAITSVPAQDRTFLESWGDGPVTLIGDAAHPMLTSLSQGAGSAIEDGYVLAHHLAQAGGDVTAALRRYEDARRRRTRDLVAGSRRLSKLEQWTNPIAVTVRDLAIRFAPASVIREQNIAPMRFELPA